MASAGGRQRCQHHQQHRQAAQALGRRREGGPVARDERLDVVDALRGFALFGILLANILYWSGWGMVTDEQRIAWGGAGGDWVARLIGRSVRL